MSVSGNYEGGLEYAPPVTLSDTSATVCFEATSRFYKLASFALVNTTGSGITATCYHNDGSSDLVIYKTTVSANDTVIVSDIPRAMKDGHSFKVAGAADLVVVPIVIVSLSNAPVHRVG